MVEGLLALLAARLLVDLGRHRRHGFRDAARAGEERRDVKRPLPANGDAGPRLIGPEQAGPERRDLAPGETIGALELAGDRTEQAHVVVRSSLRPISIDSAISSTPPTSA